MESQFLWHALETDSVAHELKTDIEQGLSNKEAYSRLSVNGRNELPDHHSIPVAYMFLRQIVSSMLPILLIFAGYLFYLWSENDDTKLLTTGIVILGILLVNLILGSFYELKADRFLYSLRKIARDAVYTRVLRNGYILHVRVTELVPGDIIYFEAEDQIPADGRLIEANQLTIDESDITQTKVAIEKEPSILEKNVQIHQRKNMVFAKSTVVTGRGKAIVTATGKQTQAYQEGIEDKTRAQRSEFESVFSRQGSWFALGCIILSAALGAVIVFLFKKPILDGVTAGLILMMSAWPAGLIEAVTMAFAVGMRKLSDLKIVIRNLPEAEKLADVALICCSKKGILTQNRMIVRKIFVDGDIIDVEENEDDIDSKIFTDNKNIDLTLLLTTACMSTNAEVKQTSEGWSVEGDPTEGALIIAAMKGGVNKDELSLSLTRVGEIPYDPIRKRISVIYKDSNDEIFVFTRGAVENIVAVCCDMQLYGYVERLNTNRVRAVRSVSHNFAKDHTECVALAYSPLEGDLSNYTVRSIERDMIFIGMIGLVDPPRTDVKQAVRKCFMGGIKPIMLTDDGKETAISFARELGIARGESDVLTGEELDTLGEKEFYDIQERFSIYADVSPEQKARIIRTLKESGRITAMIGASANDADAIQEAHIGIAAGQMGSSVSINASDVLIMDNSFSTAVKAIEGTRSTLQNVKKVIRYFLSISLATASIILFSFIVNIFWKDFAFPPLSLLQILWINLVASSIPAIGIIFNPFTATPLGDGAYAHGRMFNSELKINILIRGILTAIFAIIVYAFSLGPTDSWDANQDRAMTAAMTILVMSQLAFAFQCCRTSEEGFFRKFFRNRLLLGLVFLVILMHLAIIYVPIVSIIFGTKPLSLIDWIPIIVAFAIFWLPLDELFTTNVEYEEEYEERSYERRDIAEDDLFGSEDTEKDDQSDSDNETV